MASQPPSTRPAAPRLPALARRRQLLDVAVDVFAARGFHGASMEELAEAAGVTKPVLYQHFSSKRELYLELLDDLGTRLVAAVTGAVRTASGPRSQVEAGFGAYFRFVAEQTGAFNVLFGSGARRDEEFAGAVRGLEDQMARSVAELIEADIDGEHRQLLGWGILGLAETTSRYWVRMAGTDPGTTELTPAEADRMARRIADLAWAGLRGVRRD